HSVTRISADLPRAREIGEALLTPALSRLRAANDPAQVRELTGLMKTGRMYRLARERFPKMPLFPRHPTFEGVSYRTPPGIRPSRPRPGDRPGRRPAGGPPKRPLPRLHERGGEGHDAPRRAHRRARAHDDRRRRPLARRLRPHRPRRLRAAEGRRDRDPADLAARGAVRRAWQSPCPVGDPRG